MMGKEMCNEFNDVLAIKCAMSSLENYVRYSLLNQIKFFARNIK